VNVRYGTVDAEYARRLAETSAADDGPVWMVNLMQYREVADYTDGRPDRISGREADDRYLPSGPLDAVGAEIVFAGKVEEQLLGDAPKWDRIAVVKYPTRRSFTAMQERADFQALHVHKDAALASTIVMAGQPMGSPGGADSELPDWSEVPHPPTDDDGPLMVVHALRFHEDLQARTPDDMNAYTGHAAEVAVPHGGRVSGWFAVEGTVVGDGRRWDQVRFNLFPSRRAFMAVVFDPDRLAAQRDHREPAIADTYTLTARPVIDRIADSMEDH